MGKASLGTTEWVNPLFWPWREPSILLFLVLHHQWGSLCSHWQMTSVLSDSWFPGWPCAVVGPSCQTALSFQTPLPQSGLFSQVKTRWTWSGEGEPGLGRAWFSLFHFIPLWRVWFYDDWHVFFFTIKKETNRFFQNVKWLPAQMISFAELWSWSQAASLISTLGCWTNILESTHMWKLTEASLFSRLKPASPE